MLEVDAPTGRGAACWVGARRVAHGHPPVAFDVTEWTTEDEALLSTERVLAIWQLVTAEVRGRIVLVGDALGVWFGMVRFSAKAKKINAIFFVQKGRRRAS